MNFFTSGIFWFIEGIFAVVITLGFNQWVKDHNIKMYWWKWVGFYLVVISFGFTIAFVTTSVGENEKTAALRGGLVFGLLSFVLSGLFYRLLLVNKP